MRYEINTKKDNLVKLYIICKNENLNKNNFIYYEEMKNKKVIGR